MTSNLPKADGVCNAVFNMYNENRKDYCISSGIVKCDTTSCALRCIWGINAINTALNATSTKTKAGKEAMTGLMSCCILTSPT